MMAYANQDEYDYLFKIVLIGDSSVGKSSISRKFIDSDGDIYGMKSTIGVEFVTKSLPIKDKVVKMQVWDTAGQERYRAITSAYYRGALGAMLVYDIGNKETFDNLERWIKELRNNAGEDIVIILLGNKIDLDRAISREMATRFAETHRVDYLEVSAMLCEGINSAFEKMAESIYSKITMGVKTIAPRVMPSQSVVITPEVSDVPRKPKKSCC
jgi:Ras-related protein Rab-11A